MGMRLLIALGALVIGALGFAVLEQGRHIERLDGELHALRTSVQAHPSKLSVPVASSPIYAPVARSVPAPQPEQVAEAKELGEMPAVGVPVEARAPVTHDEVARVESAVLSLLEADRPELRAKLRAVVQEQQQTLEQEQREERRERWATRREARLLELGNQIGLTEEQRAAMMHIMLATRDQIGDLRQSAQTPEAINASRDQARALREQSEEQIRQLLKPAQYEAYKAQFADDDEAERQRRGGERGAPPP